MNVQWVAVCRYCGKAGGKHTRSESQGRPTMNPPSMGGKCPSSPTGKHAPQWVRA